MSVPGRSIAMLPVIALAVVIGGCGGPAWVLPAAAVVAAAATAIPAVIEVFDPPKPAPPTPSKEEKKP